ncbi:hypothetical protein AGMMS49950_08440 [Endomicrobiia bacterium]|nr:hypothetical protein AGMMS49950_08440 [Endomicrobiia bacterium]
MDQISCEDSGIGAGFTLFIIDVLDGSGLVGEINGFVGFITSYLGVSFCFMLPELIGSPSGGGSIMVAVHGVDIFFGSAGGGGGNCSGEYDRVTFVQVYRGFSGIIGFTGVVVGLTDTDGGAVKVY